MIDDYTEARDDAQQLQVYDFPFLLYRFSRPIFSPILIISVQICRAVMNPSV